MTSYPPGMTLRPLDSWPFDLTKNRRRPAFASGFTETIDLLDRELFFLENPHAASRGSYGRYPQSVLQIALREQDFRLDGLPRASAIPAHPGVILNIEASHRPPLSFPCDTFTHWHHNLRAVALALEALRKIDRYGVTQTGQQYRGWQAIEATPSVDATAAACALLARVAWPNENDEHQASWAPKIATDVNIGRNTYKKARANAHPDRNGGDQALWDQVEQAAKSLRAAGVSWVGAES
jgi:hypothetical protein